MSERHGRHGHRHGGSGHQKARSRRRRQILAAAALLLALGWLAWNALLVESDVAEVATDAGSAPAEAPPAR